MIKAGIKAIMIPAFHVFVKELSYNEKAPNRMV